MKHLDWVRVRDDYLWYGKANPDDYEQLDEWQRIVMREFKNSFNKYKRRGVNNKGRLHHSLIKQYESTRNNNKV